MFIGLLLEVEPLRCPLDHPLIYIGHTATVFGATGFLGRYIVNRLGMLQADKGLENMLMRSSNARMYRRCTISGGDGQEAFESHRRSWEGYVHGQRYSWSLQRFATDPVIRNTISGTLLR